MIDAVEDKRWKSLGHALHVLVVSGLLLMSQVGAFGQTASPSNLRLDRPGTAPNKAPIPGGFPLGGEVTLEAGLGGSLDLDLTFDSPELGQSTTVTIQDIDNAVGRGLMIVNTPGNTATVQLDWSPDCSAKGDYLLNFIATDSHNPPGVTPISLTLHVLCTQIAEPGTKSSPSASPSSSSAGSCSLADGDDLLDPVYLFSGEFYERVTDLEIRSRGLNFIWSRTYNSRKGPNTKMGNGWDYSYNVSAELDGSSLIVRDGNGRSDTYTQQLDGSWTAAEFFRQITQNLDGTLTVTFQDTGYWTLHALDGSPSAGMILDATDRNGNTVGYSYDGQGRLITIHDPLDDPGTHNRDITIAYNADGFVASVTDYTGRQVQYAYYQNGDAGGSFGDLKSVTTPAVTGTPHGNDYPSGKTTTYTYSKGFANQLLNHNLLSITDPKGQTYLTNVYATTQDPNELTFDRVVRQVWGDAGDIIDVTYLRQTPVLQNNFATTKVILNDRVGNVKELFYDALNRGVIQREFTGRAPDADAPTTEADNRPIGQLRSGDPVYFETTHEYNADSLLTRTVHPNGNEETFTYDVGNADPRARGNLLQHCWLAGPLGGDQGVICESFEYDNGFGGCCGTNFVVKHTDGRGNVTRHQYDAVGNRIQTSHNIIFIIEDWEYNASGQVTAHVLPDNGSAHRRRDEYTYYSSGPLTGYLKDEIVDATGFALKTTHFYDQLGRQLAVTDPRGNSTHYAYNQLDQVVRISPPGSLHRDLFYDADNNVVRIDILNVDDQGNIVAANPYFTTIHELDVLNHVVRTCQEKGSFDVQRTPPQLDCAGLPPAEFVTTEYAYDANRNRTLTRHGEATNGNDPSNVVAVLYDERDLVFRRIRAQGHADQSTSQLDYDNNKNPVLTLEGLEDSPRATVRDFDGHNRLRSIVDPMGNVTTHHYDPTHNRVLTRVEGELVDVAGSTSNVRLSEVTYLFDPMNRRLNEIREFFDTQTQAPLPGGQQFGKSRRSVQYSDNSQVIRDTNDNSHVTLTAYDTANRKSVVTDAKGNTVTTSYDASSNVTQIVEVELSDLGIPSQTFVTTFAYDGLDRLIVRLDTLGNIDRFGYDSRNNQVAQTDALGRVTRRDYDGLSRLVQTVRDMNGNGPSSGDPIDIVTTQLWDDTSRLTGQGDDNGNVTVYAYDSLDRKSATVYADGTADVVLAFDVHDSALNMQDANGSVVASTYDLLDRVTAKVITPGSGVSNDTTFEVFKYDGLSRLVSAQDDDSLVTRGHDSLSQITSENLNGQVTSCVYDGVGNGVTCVYPSGRTITCLFDALERKQTIFDGGGLIASYDYVGPERVERREYGNGTRSDFTYDGILGVPNPANDFGVQKIIQTTHSVIGSGAILDDRTYTWDAVHSKTRRADVRAGGPMLVHDFGYDAADRMIQSVKTPPGGPSGTIDYSLDGVGNRTAVTGGPQPGAYTMDPTLSEPADLQVNQYTTTPFDARQYDTKGNLISADPGVDSERSYAYDYRNRMVEFTGQETRQSGDLRTQLRARYAYDALGRRIAKLVLPAKTDLLPSAGHGVRYFYHAWQVVEEQDAAGAAEATYVYGNYIDEVLTMQREGADSYYHADDNYNVMALSDAAGNVVERYEYQDYGAPEFLDSTGTSMPASAVENSYLFTGRRRDAETRLYYYRTRYLDPRPGRFTARDSLGTWGDSRNCGNAVTYCANSPTASTDPNGQFVNAAYDLIMFFKCCAECDPTGDGCEGDMGACGDILKCVAWCMLTPPWGAISSGSQCSGTRLPARLSVLAESTGNLSSRSSGSWAEAAVGVQSSHDHVNAR
ncbi:MAG: RHS repeat-associated core domain-containing protein [Planctomycetota bacterium]